jgi:YggT family protein
VFIFGNLLEALAGLLHLVLNIYIWIIIARAIISWVNPDPYNPIVRFLYRVTEPALRPIRNLLPMQGIGLDLSPMILLLVIYILDSFVVRTLRDLASTLR